MSKNQGGWKPTSGYEQFIDAQIEYVQCVRHLDWEALKGQNEHQLNQQCLREQQKIKSLLKDSDMSFTAVLKDKIYQLEEQKGTMMPTKNSKP